MWLKMVGFVYAVTAIIAQQVISGDGQKVDMHALNARNATNRIVSVMNGVIQDYHRNLRLFIRIGEAMPDTNPDAVKLLSDDEVAEIAARPWVYPYLRNTEQRVLLRVAERDALCATVRALRAENELADKVFKLILPNRPLATISELAKPVLDEVDALREQLAQSQSELSRWRGRWSTCVVHGDVLVSYKYKCPLCTAGETR